MRMDEETDNQDEIKIDKRKTMPHLWKKGQSGNPLGRPKGKTMKEWAKEYLERMTDEERDEWLEGVPKDLIWRMSEGNPKQDTDITSAGRPIIAISPEIADKNALNPSSESDS